jgi:hypothetical protein
MRDDTVSLLICAHKCCHDQVAGLPRNAVIKGLELFSSPQLLLSLNDAVYSLQNKMRAVLGANPIISTTTNAITLTHAARSDASLKAVNS